MQKNLLKIGDLVKTTKTHCDCSRCLNWIGKVGFIKEIKSSSLTIDVSGLILDLPIDGAKLFFNDYGKICKNLNDLQKINIYI